MKTNSTVRYCFIPMRMAGIKKIINVNVDTKMLKGLLKNNGEQWRNPYKNLYLHINNNIICNISPVKK